MKTRHNSKIDGPGQSKVVTRLTSKLKSPKSNGFQSKQKSNTTCLFCKKVFMHASSRILHERTHTVAGNSENSLQKNRTFKQIKTRKKTSLTVKIKPTRRSTHKERKGSNSVASSDMIKPEQLNKVTKDASDTINTDISLMKPDAAADFGNEIHPSKKRLRTKNANFKSLHKKQHLNGLKTKLKEKYSKEDSVCQYCRKKLSSKQNCQRHERLHTNVKPYRCNACPEAFTNSTYLKRHMIKMHSSVPVTHHQEQVKQDGVEFREDSNQNLADARQNDTMTRKRVKASRRKEITIDQQHHENEMDDVQVPSINKQRHTKSVIQMTTEMGGFTRKKPTTVKTLTSPSAQEIKKASSLMVKCQFCSKEYSSKTWCTRHETTHRPPTGNLPYKCTTCFASFSSQRYLNCHDASVHDRDLFVCQYCKKKLSSVYGRVMHERLHSNEKPHVCKYCKEAFPNTKYLKRHVKRIHTGDIDTNQVQQSKDKVDNQQKQTKVVVETTDITASMDGIEGNKKHPHTKSVMLNSMTTETGGFAKNKTSTVKTPISPNAQEAMKASVVLKCQFCSKEYSSKTLCARHEATHRPPTANFPYKCTTCFASFSSQRYLNCHDASVHGRDLLVCQYCKKKLSSVYGRVMHERLHSNEKPYGCKYCKEAFPNTKYLQRHVTRIHTGKVYNGWIVQVGGDHVKQKKDKVDNQQKQKEVVLETTDITAMLRRRTLSDEEVRVLENLVVGKMVSEESVDSNKHQQKQSSKRKSPDSPEEDPSGPKVQKTIRLLDSKPVQNLPVMSLIHKSKLQTTQRSKGRQNKVCANKCPTCHLPFSSQRLLNSHELSVHDRNLLVCQYCKKRLSSVSTRVTHERLHTHEKPYGCKYCKETFSDTTYLPRHVKRIHSGKVYTGWKMANRKYDQEHTMDKSNTQVVPQTANIVTRCRRSKQSAKEVFDCQVKYDNKVVEGNNLNTESDYCMQHQQKYSLNETCPECSNVADEGPNEPEFERTPALSNDKMDVKQKEQDVTVQKTSIKSRLRSSSVSNKKVKFLDQQMKGDVGKGVQERNIDESASCTEHQKKQSAKHKLPNSVSEETLCEPTVDRSPNLLNDKVDEQQKQQKLVTEISNLNITRLRKSKWSVKEVKVTDRQVKFDVGKGVKGKMGVNENDDNKKHQQKQSQKESECNSGLDESSDLSKLKKASQKLHSISAQVYPTRSQTTNPKGLTTQKTIGRQKQACANKSTSCHTAFTSQRPRNTHDTSIHEQDLCMCRYCKKMFSSLVTRLAHEGLHTIKKSYVALCQKPFPSTEYLQHHFNKMHIKDEDDHDVKLSNGRLSVTVKDQTTKRQQALTSETILTATNAESCLKSPNQEQSFQRTSNEYNSSMTESSVGQQQVQTNTTKSAVLKPSDENVKFEHRTGSSKSPGLCTYCGKYFTRSDNCRVHEKYCHMGLTPYTCVSCGTSFGYQRDLCEHRKICHTAKDKQKIKKEKKKVTFLVDKSLVCKNNDKIDMPNNRTQCFESDGLTDSSSSNSQRMHSTRGSHQNLTKRGQPKQGSSAGQLKKTLRTRTTPTLTKRGTDSSAGNIKMVSGARGHQNVRKCRGAKQVTSPSNPETKSPQKLCRETNQRSSSHQLNKISKSGTTVNSTKSENDSPARNRKRMSGVGSLQNLNKCRKSQKVTTQNNPQKLARRSKPQNLTNKNGQSKQRSSSNKLEKTSRTRTPSTCTKIGNDSSVSKRRTLTVRGPQDLIKCRKVKQEFPSQVQTTISHRGSLTKDRKSKAGTCNYCGKTFTRKENALIHERAVHLKLKPYTCKWCKRQFGWPDYLYKHVKMKHQDEERSSANGEMTSTDRKLTECKDAEEKNLVRQKEQKQSQVPKITAKSRVSGTPNLNMVETDPEDICSMETTSEERRMPTSGKVSTQSSSHLEALQKQEAGPQKDEAADGNDDLIVVLKYSKSQWQVATPGSKKEENTSQVLEGLLDHQMVTRSQRAKSDTETHQQNCNNSVIQPGNRTTSQFQTTHQEHETSNMLPSIIGSSCTSSSLDAAVQQFPVPLKSSKTRNKASTKHVLNSVSEQNVPPDIIDTSIIQQPICFGINSTHKSVDSLNTPTASVQNVHSDTDDLPIKPANPLNTPHVCNQPVTFGINSTHKSVDTLNTPTASVQNVHSDTDDLPITKPADPLNTPHVSNQPVTFGINSTHKSVDTLNTPTASVQNVHSDTDDLPIKPADPLNTPHMSNQPVTFGRINSTHKSVDTLNTPTASVQNVPTNDTSIKSADTLNTTINVSKQTISDNNVSTLQCDTNIMPKLVVVLNTNMVNISNQNIHSDTNTTPKIPAGACSTVNEILSTVQISRNSDSENHLQNGKMIPVGTVTQQQPPTDDQAIIQGVTGVGKADMKDKPITWRCEECMVVFDCKKALLYHRRSHVVMVGTAMPKENFSYNEVYCSPEGLYKCNVCSAVFTQERQFKSHEFVHTRNMDHWYGCPQCGMEYKRQKDWMAHMVSHGNKEYLCKYCGKTFRVIKNWWTHEQLHEKDGDKM